MSQNHWWNCFGAWGRKDTAVKRASVKENLLIFLPTSENVPESCSVCIRVVRGRKPGDWIPFPTQHRASYCVFPAALGKPGHLFSTCLTVAKSRSLRGCVKFYSYRSFDVYRKLCLILSACHLPVLSQYL